MENRLGYWCALRTNSGWVNRIGGIDNRLVFKAKTKFIHWDQSRSNSRWPLLCRLDLRAFFVPILFGHHPALVCTGPPGIFAGHFLAFYGALVGLGHALLQPLRWGWATRAFWSDYNGIQLGLGLFDWGAFSKSKSAYLLKH